MNPRGEVPVLVDGGFVLADSPLICRYLAETRGCGALYPSDAAARFRALALERYSDTQLDAALFALTLIRSLLPELTARDPRLEGRVIAVLEAVYDALEGRLAASDGPHFAGAFSIADIAVVPHVASARVLGHTLDRTRWPRLSAWWKQVSSRPLVRGALVAMGQEYADWQTESDPWFTARHLHVRSDRIEALVRVGLGRWLADQLEAGTVFLSDPA